MIDHSNYSCDKCKRVGSWHCKHCWHTAEKPPTRFKPKKKTGIQTPEFRKPTPPPNPNLGHQPTEPINTRPPKPPTSGYNAVKPNPNYVPPASVKKSCPYELPCGWCTKWDKKCDKRIGCQKPTNETIIESNLNTPYMQAMFNNERFDDIVKIHFEGEFKND